MITNKVGLEAEFFCLENGKVAHPKGLPTDEFILLAEARGEPGETREVVLSNFLKEYYRIESVAGTNGQKIWFKDGYLKLTAEEYRNALKSMGRKEIAGAQNIHGLEINDYTDQLVEDGRVVGYNLSCGLHIHFSSQEVTEAEVSVIKDNFVLVNLPISIGDVSAKVELFRKTTDHPVEDRRKAVATAGRITKPVVTHIVTEMDKLLEKFQPNIQLKHRMPGYYEMKPHGFEYRSLSFSQKTFTSLPEITDYALKLLYEI